MAVLAGISDSHKNEPAATHLLMISTNRIIRGLRRRLRYARKKAELGLRHRLAGRTIWVDYGWMRLPYHSDEDQQELYYHLDGDLWYEYERKVLSPYIGPGAVAIDVGANLGFLTTLLSKMVTPGGTVYSFEPSPTTFRKLEEVITENNLENVHAFNAGCGEQCRSLELYCTASSGHSTLNRPACSEDVRSIEKVAIVRLDEFLGPQVTRIDLLKIDTEGHEDSVIAGACELLDCFRPVIYLELTSEYIDCSRRAVSLLKAAGYRFLTEPVLENCHNGQNFIAVPAELSARHP